MIRFLTFVASLDAIPFWHRIVIGSVLGGVAGVAVTCIVEIVLSEINK